MKITPLLGYDTMQSGRNLSVFYGVHICELIVKIQANNQEMHHITV